MAAPVAPVTESPSGIRGLVWLRRREPPGLCRCVGHSQAATLASTEPSNLGSGDPTVTPGKTTSSLWSELKSLPLAPAEFRAEEKAVVWFGMTGPWGSVEHAGGGTVTR
jgi:hypothetical protein